MALDRWIVRAGSGSIHAGLLRAGSAEFQVSMGRSGIGTTKQEGDGVTPAGSFPLRRLLWRADRLPRPVTCLPCTPILPRDGWCDAALDARYNRPVMLPYPASAEALWRPDGVYDLVLVIGHNDNPVIPGAGSAVFFHLCRADRGPTAGCLAASLSDLLQLVGMATPATVLEIQAG